jgi:adenylate cyclase
MSSLNVLNDHLSKYTLAESDVKRAEVESDIWKKFGKTGVVCIIDMCGFTKVSQQHGIIYYLALVRRMQKIVGPIVTKNRGHVVKFEADNCFARFINMDDAMKAIQNIFFLVKKENLTTPSDFDISLSVGMDYGKFLLLKQIDYWGEAVNRASKLGEDIAGSGVVLLTDNAWQNLSNKDEFTVKRHNMEISNVIISAFEVLSFH